MNDWMIRELMDACGYDMHLIPDEEEIEYMYQMYLDEEADKRAVEELYRMAQEDAD